MCNIYIFYLIYIYSKWNVSFIQLFCWYCCISQMLYRLLCFNSILYLYILLLFYTIIRYFLFNIRNMVSVSCSTCWRNGVDDLLVWNVNHQKETDETQIHLYYYYKAIFSIVDVSCFTFYSIFSQRERRNPILIWIE